MTGFGESEKMISTSLSLLHVSLKKTDKKRVLSFFYIGFLVKFLWGRVYEGIVGMIVRF